MTVGRFFCVLFPSILAAASIIFLLVGALAGVSNKSLYLFQVNFEGFSISPADVEDISLYVNGSKLDKDANSTLETRAEKHGGNITADLLGLERSYDVSLWGYCHTDHNGERKCEKHRFDWASESLNSSYVGGVDRGIEVELPDKIKSALNTFKAINKFTEVVFILSFILLPAELVFGNFANTSRRLSCLTWIVADLAAVLVLASAILSSALASIFLAVIKGTAELHGIKAETNGRFLAVVWIAASLAIGAGFFWAFTICCCKPDYHDRYRGSQHHYTEELLGGKNNSAAYARLSDDHEMQTAYHGPSQSHPQPQNSDDEALERLHFAYEAYTASV
ncbi:hypothetical protein FSARC_3418 [Fusarium sarcochroum]|uniref:Integral membrane protein n=1 Tax=Fusarium sarcochroum TaxID=1208366 RepID=A0A8H4U3Z8_9HYPO|nr:hypothetical protein FSARC_3418 [Fusarium sarcochroum]